MITDDAQKTNPNFVDPGRGTSPVLRAILPGALMFQYPHPLGVLERDPERRRQFNALFEATALAGLPSDERAAVLESAAKTYTRSVYHHKRFVELRAELDIRRTAMPGEIVWDTLVDYVHFELQAFAAASRTLVDELVYVIARCHGKTPAQAKKDPWTASQLFGSTLATECQVPEILALRARKDWFDMLNAYRNTFFHSGWKHGSGYFPVDDDRLRSRTSSSNGLLVPDRESLAGKTRPHQWTWTRRTTVDDIARQIRDGMAEVIKAIFEDEWRTPVPDAGSAPIEERPNMLVGLVRPAILETEQALFLPLFSSREIGQAFAPFRDDSRFELVDAPTSCLVVGQRAVSVSLAGLEQNRRPTRVTHIEAVLDPIADVAWIKVQAKAHIRMPIAEIMENGSIQPVSMVLPDIQRIWMWRPVEGRAP